jgi:hypothetical protein
LAAFLLDLFAGCLLAGVDFLRALLAKNFFATADLPDFLAAGFFAFVAFLALAAHFFCF